MSTPTTDFRFSSIIRQFESSLLAEYGPRLLPVHRKTLSAMKACRNTLSPKMLAQCEACETQRLIPHSCGNRHCPHCQAHESQQWLEGQLKKRVPADYFLVTFTLPAEFRGLARRNQQTIYSAMMVNAWDTLKTFGLNDAQLQGITGAVAVLHTHSRALDYHPHVHLVVPAGAIDRTHRLWRTRRKTKTGKRYLFCHKALAKMFRGKMLDAIRKAGLPFPRRYPEKWVVDCKAAGNGEKALVYLGRYLYRGVIREKDILSVEDGCVTYRYRESKTKTWKTRTLTGAAFLWTILQHVLPKGFRRARNYGFLHPNSKQLIQVLQRLFNIDPNRIAFKRTERPPLRCPCCEGIMKILKTRIRSLGALPMTVPT
jgi:hypothetical protein